MKKQNLLVAALVGAVVFISASSHAAEANGKKTFTNYTKGKLPLVAKNKDGQLLKSKVEALDDPRGDTPDLLPPAGTTEQASFATGTGKAAGREIKEWQAIMDHLRRLPAKKGELPVIPADERANEVRAIKAG